MLLFSQSCFMKTLLKPELSLLTIMSLKLLVHVGRTADAESASAQSVATDGHLVMYSTGVDLICFS